MLSESELRGKTAIITGGGNGAGAVYSQALARLGVAVAVADIDGDAASGVVESITAEGGRALAVSVDLAEPDQIQAMVDRTVEEFGHLDILINNAAMIPGPTPLLEASVDVWDRMFAINTRAVFLATQAAARVMVPQGGGVIVNVSSISAFTAFGQKSIYEASKAAVSQLTASLAIETASLNIRINAFAPGLIVHPRQTERMGGPERIAKAASLIPLGRAAEPDDYVGPLVFLCSDASRFITGQTIVVDGGYTKTR